MWDPFPRALWPSISANMGVLIQLIEFPFAGKQADRCGIIGSYIGAAPSAVVESSPVAVVQAVVRQALQEIAMKTGDHSKVFSAVYSAPAFFGEADHFPSCIQIGLVGEPPLFLQGSGVLLMERLGMCASGAYRAVIRLDTLAEPIGYTGAYTGSPTRNLHSVRNDSKEKSIQSGLEQAVSAVRLLAGADEQVPGAATPGEGEASIRRPVT